MATTGSGQPGRRQQGLASWSIRAVGAILRTTYRALLDQHGCLRAQSRRDEGLDNAQAGSLWSRLKTEELGPRE